MSEHTPWATNLRNENAKLIAENKRLTDALRHIRDCYWTDGEPFEDRLEHIQEYAKQALN